MNDECITDEDLVGFVDHQLSVEASARVERHVATCGDCRLVLSELVRGPASGADFERGPLRRGATLGRYVLEEVIGAGGMGVVFSARDPELKREVAVKVLKDVGHGRRFEHEKRILAGLEHPNIARLLDGGVTSDGRPYLVMELVRGVPIEAFADRARATVTERLQLFRQVCAAVQYAHQNLIVHRDLKPGNILVTSEGQVKLLDFGIAKLLEDDDSRLTSTGVHAMTPAFASPEQVSRDVLTTASDVYSLGVVLFELLVGVLPYRAPPGDLDALLKAVREEDPEPPSEALTRAPDSAASARGSSPPRLRARLRGDVDAIVLRALRKEPAARYATAEQLSEDLRRHLDGLPTLARRDTTGYRLSKFVKRHLPAVAAVTTAFVSLTLGTIATAWQALEASRARDKAERRFVEVRALAHQVLFDYHDAAAQLPGATALRQRMVKDALGYLDRLAQESADDPSLQRELAAAYLKIGSVQGDPYSASLGDTAGALASYRRGVELSTALLKAAPEDLETLRLASETQLKLGDLLGISGDLASAVAAYREAIALNTRLTARLGASPADRAALAVDWLALGAVLGEQGKLEEALEAAQISLRLRQALASDERSPRNRRAVAASHVSVGDVQCKRGLSAECLREYEEATSLYEGVVAEAPEFQPDLGPLYQRLGLALVEQGETSRAVEVFRKSHAVNRARAAADPDDAVAQRHLAGSCSSLGGVLLDTGAVAEALELYRTTLAITRTLHAADPSNAQAARDVGLTLYELGKASLRAGRLEAAEQEQTEGLSINEALLAAAPGAVVAQADVADHLVQLGRIKELRGSRVEALAHFERARLLLESVVVEAPDNATYEASRASVYLSLARALDVRGASATERAKACRWWKASVDAWRPMLERKNVPRELAEEPALASQGLAHCPQD